MVTTTNVHRFVDKTQVRDAIAASLHITSAPIHVSIAPYFWGSVQMTAKRAFRRHRLGHTRNNNAILFFVVPSRRQFVIIGDVGAHEALGQHVWESSAIIVQDHFARGDTTLGLLEGIKNIGNLLAERFPPR